MTPQFDITKMNLCEDISLLKAHYNNKGEIYFWRKSPPFSSGEWRIFQGHISNLDRDDVYFAIGHPLKFSTMAIKHSVITRFKQMILKLAEYSESSDRGDIVSCHSLLYIDEQFSAEWNSIIKDWMKLTSGGLNGYDDVSDLVKEEIDAERKQQQVHDMIKEIKQTASKLLNNKELTDRIYYDRGMISIPLEVIFAITQNLGEKTNG